MRRDPATILYVTMFALGVAIASIGASIITTGVNLQDSHLGESQGLIRLGYVVVVLGGVGCLVAVAGFAHLVWELYFAADATFLYTMPLDRVIVIFTPRLNDQFSADISLVFRNAGTATQRYRIKNISVSIAGLTNHQPNFVLMENVIPPGQEDEFLFPDIQNVPKTRPLPGFIYYEIDYGNAETKPTCKRNEKQAIQISGTTTGQDIVRTKLISVDERTVKSQRW